MSELSPDSPWNWSRFDGKVAIVTGAASGIGAAVAKALASVGAEVVTTDRNEDGLNAARGEIEAAGGSASVVVADLLDPEAPEKIVQATLETYGAPSILVNCAGIFEARPIEEMTPELWDRQLTINLRAPFFLTRAAVPHLSAGSSVTFIASGTAALPSAFYSAYAASKGGVVSLVRALAAELSPRGIRVNSISPGNTETPMIAEVMADPSVRKQVEDVTPARRLGTPDDIAGAVLFFASDAASFVHGANLSVDGGLTTTWSMVLSKDHVAGVATPV